MWIGSGTTGTSTCPMLTGPFPLPAPTTHDTRNCPRSKMVKTVRLSVETVLR